MDHLIEWMKIQEEANKEIARLLLHIDERLKRIEQRQPDIDRCPSCADPRKCLACGQDL